MEQNTETIMNPKLKTESTGLNWGVTGFARGGELHVSALN